MSSYPLVFGILSSVDALHIGVEMSVRRAYRVISVRLPEVRRTTLAGNGNVLGADRLYVLAREVAHEKEIKLLALLRRFVRTEATRLRRRTFKRVVVIIVR